MVGLSLAQRVFLGHDQVLFADIVRPRFDIFPRFFGLEGKAWDRARRRMPQE